MAVKITECFKYLLGKFIDNFFSIIIASIITSGTLTVILDKYLFIDNKVYVPIWFLFSLVILLAIVLFKLRSSSKKINQEYSPVLITEKCMDLNWSIQEPAQRWISQPVNNFGGKYIDSILNGPFCKECDQEYESEYDRFKDDYILKIEQCWHCGKKLTQYNKKPLYRRFLKSHICKIIQGKYRKTKKLPVDGQQYSLFSENEWDSITKIK